MLCFNIYIKSYNFSFRGTGGGLRSYGVQKKKNLRLKKGVDPFGYIYIPHSFFLFFLSFFFFVLIITVRETMTASRETLFWRLRQSRVLGR